MVVGTIFGFFRAFLIAQVRRRWGNAAVRERARMLLGRLPQVGHSRLRERHRSASCNGVIGSAALFQDGALGLSMS